MCPRLVLVGGGHSHVLVLADFAARPESHLELSVVSAGRDTTYSGMVPGVIAGQYALRDAQIDVAALTQRAGGTFVVGRAVAVDAERRLLERDGGGRDPYDLLSFDIGAQTPPPPLADLSAPLIPLKPIESALAALERALAAPPGRQGRRIVVAGAGAGGAEVAFALRARLAAEPDVSITVCDKADRPVAERGRRTATLVERAFAEHRIRFVGGAGVEQIARTAVRLEQRGELPADLVVWAAGAAPQPLFAASGLPVDRHGYLQICDELRCPTRPEIFGAGDCASLLSHPDLPKAGVYAVRQGPVLAHNLRAAARRETLTVFRPQPRFLALLNTGDGRAILSYGRFAARGRWAWRLKDWIDRRFMARFR